jgi:hypothetical protein
VLLTLADCGPPDVLESARTLAVDTLNLVRANDAECLLACIECGARLIAAYTFLRITALSLTSAADTTAVGLEATIEGASNLLGLRKGLGTLRGGNGDGSALGEAGERGGSLVRGAGSGNGGKSQDGSSDGSLHVVGWMLKVGNVDRKIQGVLVV